LTSLWLTKRVCVTVIQLLETEEATTDEHR